MNMEKVPEVENAENKQAPEIEKDAPVQKMFKRNRKTAQKFKLES